MIKSNFHTHSKFCDGADTLEEMVLEAIERGFTDLGFSGHGYTEYSTEYCMKKEGTAKYISEIYELQTKYKDKIRIYCGVEKDYYSKESNHDFQYIIGSVHYVKKDGVYYPVDSSPDGTLKAINAFGDLNVLSKEFFATAANVACKTNCDIIGHFDLLSKYFDTLGIDITPQYLQYAENAVDSLVPYNKPFEINTGALARGIKGKIYPSVDILKMIYSRGGKIILSSDCHNKEHLDFAFEEAINLAKEVGFKSIVSIRPQGMQEYGINEFKI